MTKKTVSKSFTFLVLLYLLSITQTLAQSNNETQILGGDVDKHGCKPSAGYQWSSIRKECIRVFETGLRLNPKAANLDKTLSAFVVFKSETERENVELFAPDGKNSFVLKKVKGAKIATWKNALYTLKLDKGKYQLRTVKGILLYESGEN